MLNKEICHKIFKYEDGVLYWKFRNDLPRQWNTRFVGKRAGWKTSTGYYSVTINNIKYKVHRLIFMMFNGFFPKEVDHINNNRIDNRIENLRASDKTTNKHNSLKPITNTSGIKGVSWHKKNKNWRCSLWTNNKSKEVSGFKTKELAQEFIELWREMAHGKFANHG
jgi:hypothetical protein